MKDIDIHIRLSKEYLCRIDKNAAAAGMKRSEYIRHAAGDLDIETATVLVLLANELREANLELHRQGNNINQIAKILNTYKKDSDSKILMAQLNRLRSKNDEIGETIMQMKIAISEIIGSRSRRKRRGKNDSN